LVEGSAENYLFDENQTLIKCGAFYDKVEKIFGKKW